MRAVPQYEAGTMIRFVQLFPETGKKECRIAGTVDHPKLGTNSYFLEEVYCVAPRCDCRRVIINLVRTSDHEHLATVNWGFDEDDEDRGPFLDVLNEQSDLCDALLDLVKGVLGHDRKFVERLERHYRMVKEAAADPDHEVHETLRDVPREEVTAPFVSAAGIGRNDPCPCGSGRKYKKCCMGE